MSDGTEAQPAREGDDEASRLRNLATDVRDLDDLERAIGRQVRTFTQYMVLLAVAYTVQADKMLLEQADERDQKRLDKTTADRAYVILSGPGLSSQRLVVLIHLSQLLASYLMKSRNYSGAFLNPPAWRLLRVYRLKSPILKQGSQPSKQIWSRSASVSINAMRTVTMAAILFSRLQGTRGFRMRVRGTFSYGQGKSHHSRRWGDGLCFEHLPTCRKHCSKPKKEKRLKTEVW